MIHKLRQRLADDQRGFTLIELLIVIVIIGILIAIAVPSYLGFRDRAANNAAKSNVRAIVPAIEARFADDGNYTGMTLTELKTEYDQTIDDSATSPYYLEVGGANTYCIKATVSGKVWYKNGPSATITDATPVPASCTA